MDVYLDDEHNFYMTIALDMLSDAWSRYSRSVESVVVVLREHEFSEEEIRILIEISRK